MKKLLFIILMITLYSCTSNVKTEKTGNSLENNETQSVTQGVIEHVLIYSNLTFPSDGDFDSDEDYNNTEEQFTIREIKNKTYFYCYDTETLFKIELLGIVKNGEITFITRDGSKIMIEKDISFENTYNIVPSKKNNYLSGGRIVVKENDKVIYELIIEYDGCL